MSSTARYGLSVLPSTLASTLAPMAAPMAPGMARRSTSRRSMFLKRQCDTPAATPVATLARLMLADAAAGLTPALSRMLDDVGPNPMPSAPSTIEATKPPAATTSRFGISE